MDGKFRRLKWAIMAVTLAIYYVTPWLRWDRGPYAPDQAVLVDLAHRRFYMFGIEIWPHEFYYVAGLLVMAWKARAGRPQPHMPAHLLRAGLVVAVIALAPLVPWVWRNLHTMHRFELLAPRYRG